MRRSLTVRIILLSIIWITLALVVTVILLRMMYRDHIELHYDAHVFTHLEELVAATEVGADGEYHLQRQPTDPNFHRPGSGWYWEVRVAGKSLDKSSSLGPDRLNLDGLELNEKPSVYDITGPGQEKLRAHLMEVEMPASDDPILFVATSPDNQIAGDVEDYSTELVIMFVVLGFGLLQAVVFQVILALRPLKAIKRAISDIQDGKTKRLPTDFPSDVQPLVDALNHLLDHDETLFKRARNQLGDLAHAVKNPLTVIRNEASSMPGEQGQLILDQSHVMANSIGHYLSMARVHGQKNPFGIRTDVEATVDDLRFVVEHVYREKNLDVELSRLQDCWFRGESQDLEEMAGNLLDNACKWAEKRVEVHAEMKGDRLLLVVEDDGPGIPPEKRDEVTERGSRLDQSKPGDGQGLGIVNDVSALYGGTLTLDKSHLGGLKAVLDLPAA